MKFGIILPHRHKYASSESIRLIAQEAESLGYDSLWVTDHVCVPSRVSHVRGKVFYEALMTLSYVGSITGEVELGTSVLALPAREPHLLARQVATLDAMTGGRVLLGVGTGWIQEELGYTLGTWEDRGDVLDEWIEVLRRLWREDGPVSYRGEFVAFEDILMYPKPERDVPIYVGGMQPPSLQRAARVGDGWIPWAVSPAELEDGLQTIREQGDVEKTALMTPVHLGRGEDSTYEGTFGEKHHILTGTEDEVVDTIREFEDAGLDHLILSFRDVRVFKDEELDPIVSQMRRFGETLLPDLR